jgi:hypothetical protein
VPQQRTSNQRPGEPLSQSYGAAGYCEGQKSVPSTYIRRMSTDMGLARATVPFMAPERMTIIIARAFSQDHFCERSRMEWAVSYYSARMAASPQREIFLWRCTSPDWDCNGVMPKAATTALERAKRQGHHRVDAGDGHQPPRQLIGAHNGKQAFVKDRKLFAQPAAAPP